jgi:membrane protease YdiL (CAAX protease family)
MSQSLAITPELPSLVPPRRKGRPLLAWLVIFAVVGFILWRYGTADPIDKQKYDLLNARFQGRYLVGIEQLGKSLSPGQKDGDVLYKQARETLNQHTYAQRLRFVVLAGELKGPREAGEQLRQLNQEWAAHRGAPPDEEAATAQTLERLYAAREKDPAVADPLPEEDQRELRRRLGWFGDLALTPAEGSDADARAAVLAPAWRTMVSSLILAVTMLGMGGLGLILLVTLLVVWALGFLRGGLTHGSSYSGVYAETFALYMVLFLGLSYGVHYAIEWLALRHGTIALSGLSALGSLAALGWPVLRGIPWRQVRQDIGWHKGRRPWLEPFLGIGCYAMALPMLALGVFLMLGLTALRDRLGLGPDEYGPSDAPGHPIVFWVARAHWWVWLEVFFVASIVAPIVEETMFRGVLYRYLREATSRLRPALSVIFSALVVSFLFAVIHPQGFLAVPALMGLALAFTLMREWRDTLLPAAIAHGLNNGVATVLMFFLMS